MLALGGLVLEESVYSGKQLLPSTPSYHSGFNRQQEEQNNAMPNAYNVLKIMRGSGSPEENDMIIEKYKRQGLWPSEKNHSRSFRKENDNISILEGISKYSNTNQGMKPISELQHASRRGRFGSKKRSWR